VEVLAYALSRGLVCSLQPRSAGWSRHDTRASPWRALEGAYETSSAMLRLGFSDLFVRQPAGVIIAHQMGGMIPLIALMVDDEEGRDPTRPSPPVGLDRLLRFHVDTATSGGPHVIRAGVDFFGAEHVLFAGGLPYSLRDRHSLIRRAIEAVEESGLSEDEVSAIFEGNARRLLRL
jgi:predicted TIM-barrel fold metal-dependent hydrolase